MLIVMNGLIAVNIAGSLTLKLPSNVKVSFGVGVLVVQYQIY
jgi:hypothetical protein